MDWAIAKAPTLDDIAELAEAARRSIPAPFDVHASRVVVQVADLADNALLDQLSVADPFELTGMYDGIPLTEKSVGDIPAHPDMIWLFRRAILEEWAERGNVTLGDLVTNVVVHEFAHHFGWSDADIAQIDRWWD